MKIDIYTDGASSRLPCGEYVGGVAYVGIMNSPEFPEIDKKMYSYRQGFDCTTNNAAELIAIREAIKLACVIKADYPLLNATIHTDSAYALNLITEWMWKWAGNGWVNSTGDPIKNEKLIKEIYNYMRFGQSFISFEKIKAHSGVELNEKADKMATSESAKLKEMYCRKPITDADAKI